MKSGYWRGMRQTCEKRYFKHQCSTNTTIQMSKTIQRKLNISSLNNKIHAYIQLNMTFGRSGLLSHQIAKQMATQSCWKKSSWREIKMVVRHDMRFSGQWKLILSSLWLWHFRKKKPASLITRHEIWIGLEHKCIPMCYITLVLTFKE
jgi:hypothetical protein